jgi:hypothetical protein
MISDNVNAGTGRLLLNVNTPDNGARARRAAERDGTQTFEAYHE